MEEEIYYPFKKKILLGRIVYSILLIALGYFLIAKQESLNWLTIYGWPFLQAESYTWVCCLRIFLPGSQVCT